MARGALLLAGAAGLVLLGARPPLTETERNRAAITDFARLFYAEKQVRTAFERHVARDYIQHNPGIAEFAHRIVSKTPISPEFRKYPTGATLVVDFATETWADASFGQGVTVDFIVPREIDA